MDFMLKPNKREHERPKDQRIYKRTNGGFFATSASGGPTLAAGVSVRFELEEESTVGRPVIWISGMTADEAAELGNALINAADRARALARGEK